MADRLDRAERLAFLRDGFSWPAALWTPFWMASRRLWVPLAIYTVIAGTIGGAMYFADALPSQIGLAIAALHLIVGYESYVIERWSYEQRGFSLAGTVAGKNKIECERRFFETWLPKQPVISAPAKPAGGQPANGTLAATAGKVAAAAPRAAPEVKRRSWLFGPRPA